MDLSHVLSDKVAGFPSVKQQFLFNGYFTLIYSLPYLSLTHSYLLAPR